MFEAIEEFRNFKYYVNRELRRTKKNLERRLSMNLIHNISSEVYLNNPRRIAAYFKKYPELEYVVEQTIIKIHEMFPEAELELEAGKEKQDNIIYLYIRVEDYSEIDLINDIHEARRQLRIQNKDSSGLFLITTDFQKPRKNKMETRTE